MSRRVGLRYMQSVAVTKVFLKCPPLGEEQFVNGNFETGDSTGWMLEGRHIEGPFAVWLGTRNEPEQSSEWKLHGAFSMKVVVPENGRAGVFNGYTDFDMNPMFIAVFGFHPVSGVFSGTSSPIIHIRPASSVTRNVAGFAIKNVGGTDYFFFQWSDYLGEHEENTGVVVSVGGVYSLQVGCQWSDRNVANGFAKGWINGIPVADKTGIIHYTTGFDFVVGQDVAVWLRGGARDVAAYFDDCVMHNDFVATNPFADGGPYVFMSGFETIDRGPAWEVGSDTPIGHSPPEGAKLAFIHAYVTDPKLWGCPFVEGFIEQIFPNPVPHECFKGTAIFQIETLWDDDVGCPPEPPLVWKIEVLYTDDTSTVLDMTGDPRATWVTHDLKAILEVGKTVKGIRITGEMRNCGYLVDRQGQEGAVDACTLKI